MDNKQSQAPAPAVMDESAKARAAAAAAEKARQKKMADAAADRAAGKGPKVLALVNMVAKDGTRLVKGNVTNLSQEEYDRLKSEPRFKRAPAFKDVVSNK